MLKYVRQSGVALWADDGRTNGHIRWVKPRRDMVRRRLESELSTSKKTKTTWMDGRRAMWTYAGTLHWNWSLGQSSSQLHEIRWWWWRPFVQYGSLALQQQQQLPCRPRQFPVSRRVVQHDMHWKLYTETQGRQCTSSSSRRWTNRLGGSANDQQRSSSSTFMTWRRRCL